MHWTMASQCIEQLQLATRAAAPMEFCALLLGRDRHVSAVWHARNISAAPERAFEIDPSALIAARRGERSGGPVVLGYAHSHPRGDAVPSAADQCGIIAAGELWLIFDRDAAYRAYESISLGERYHFSPVPLAMIDGTSRITS